MRQPVFPLRLTVTTVILAAIVGTATAEEAHRPGKGLPNPVTIATIRFDDMDHAAEPSGLAEPSGKADLPASITRPSGVLPLATGGPAILPALPLSRGGCHPRPALQCSGPCYRGCTPRIYYGTDASDDDPVLSMSPAVCDGCTTHWYDHARRMILRKKAITEAYKD